MKITFEEKIIGMRKSRKQMNGMLKINHMSSDAT